MPWNGTGTYNVPIAFVPDTDATAADQNNQDTDVAAGITNCMARDGQNAASANLSMGGNKLLNLANGTSTADAVAYGQLATLLPPGIVLPTAGFGVPPGYLLCDGSPVSRGTYAALFAVISTAYGAGDGVTTFNVPNLIGRVIAGIDPTGTVLTTDTINNPAIPGGSGGSQEFVMRLDQLAAHNHPAFVSDPGHSHGVNDPGHAHSYNTFTASNFTASGAGGGEAGGVIPSSTGSASTGISLQTATTGISVTTGLTGSSSPIATVQPTMVMYYIIKT